MTRQEAQAEISRLSEQIRENDRLYFIENTPAIADHEYDFLVKRLKELENAWPDLVSETSPTRRVGEKLDSKAEVVRHDVPMLSIENVYNEGELREFVASAQKNVDGPLAWVCELKIDGIAASLHYRDRKLARALTRGDGAFGEDITANVRTIRDVPLLLPEDAPESLEVRGEIYMTNANLARLNALEYDRALQTGRDFKPFANARNLTSGTIKQRDPAVCAERRLRFFAHSTGTDPGVVAPTHFEFMTRLREFGFSTAPLIKRLPNFETAFEYVKEMQERLHELDFEVDGIVMKADDFASRELIGSTSKYPKWIVACKFEKYEAQTRVNKIVVQIGKSGVVTPVAELEPVQIAGTTVSRATLHNADEIERKDVRVGDSVIVEKAGKIIPHIVRVESYLRSHENPPEPYVFPTVCPCCGSELKKDPDTVFIRCVNPECEAQFRERLAYFASKEAMDIDEIGDSIVKGLTTEPPKRGLFDFIGDYQPTVVRTFADLYRLTVGDIKELTGVKDSAQKIYDNIQESKKRGPVRLLTALSIRGVGVQTARDIIEKYRSFDTLKKVKCAEEFMEIKDVGPITAQNLFEFIQSERGSKILSDLQELGLLTHLPEEDSQEKALQSLANMNICVTGTLEHFDRKQIEETIRKLGGKVTASVSESTNKLLVGANPGASKINDAKKFNIPTISEKEFAQLAQINLQDYNKPAKEKKSKAEASSNSQPTLF